MVDPKRRPVPRLRCFDYFGPYRYFITLATAGRRRVFAGDWPHEKFIWVLSGLGGVSGFDVLAYCFMPDHLHLLMEGTETSDLARFIRIFKQKTAYMLRPALGGPLWQRSYYDRILRRDEDSRKVAAYILNNPVRTRLVDDATEYPYIGSFAAPLSDWL